MRKYLQRALIFTIVGAIALELFVFGLSFPLEHRVRGDAFGYLSIADSFNTFADVFSYAGERTVGFPALEYVVKQILAIFSPTVFLLPWINTIGVALLAMHLLAAWVFSIWVRRVKLIKSEVASNFLFIYLATFPALLGHTTSPLTDTFAIDILILALVSFGSALRATPMRHCLLFSAGTAILLGFAILLRPAYLIGVGVALAVCAGVSTGSAHRGKLATATAIIGCLALLTPYYKNCTEKYGSLCLQSPKTADVYMSVQEGLRGARILWSKPIATSGTFPIVPDEMMFENYYRQCRITSIAGFDDQSLTGCLLSRPLTLTAFIVKKWIGLFDYFRFTPYLENRTPFWLSTLSRAYGAVAWVGLSLFFITFLKLRDEKVRSSLRTMSVVNLDVVFLVSYSVVMLAQHTAIHTEERYGFPLIPLCAAMVFVWGEQLIAWYRVSAWRNLTLILTFILLTTALFVVQIFAWDQSSLRMQ